MPSEPSFDPNNVVDEHQEAQKKSKKRKLE